MQFVAGAFGSASSSMQTRGLLFDIQLGRCVAPVATVTRLADTTAYARPIQLRIEIFAGDDGSRWSMGTVLWWFLLKGCKLAAAHVDLITAAIAENYW